MAVDLVLIDIDNTIVEITEAHQNAWRLTLDRYFSVPPEMIDHSISQMQSMRPQDLTAEHPMLHLLMASKVSPNKIGLLDLQNAYKFFTSEINAHLKNVTGAKEFLVECHRKNKKVVALTNNYLAFGVERIIQAGVAEYFSAVISPEVYGFGKQNPFLFQLILKEYSIPASRVIMVGDNPITDGVCEQIGIKFVNICKDKPEVQYSYATSLIF